MPSVRVSHSHCFVQYTAANIIVIIVLLSRVIVPECQISVQQEEKHENIMCRNTTYQLFHYEWMKQTTDIPFASYSLELIDSNFTEMEVFSLPDVYKSSILVSLTMSQTALPMVLPSDTFNHLTYLKILDLSQNALSDLDFLISVPPMLEELYLSGNYIQTIPNIFTRFLKLEIVDLSNCQINHMVHSSLFFINDNWSRKVVLDLSRNAISSLTPFKAILPYGIFNFSQNLISTVESQTFNNTQLNSVDLSSSNIQTLDCEAFHFMLAFEINLSCNRINILSNNTFNHVNVYSLNLSSNNLTSIDLSAFIDSEIHKLVLADNLLDASALYHLDYDNVTILELDLSRNPLGNIQQRLPTPKNLIIFNLSNCEISSIGTQNFAHFNDLTELDLSHNMLTNLMEQSFGNLNNLKNLWLQSNAITRLRSDAFALNSLVSLDLSHNRIEFIHDKAFRNCSNLKFLTIDVCLQNDSVFHSLPAAVQKLYIQTDKSENVQNDRFNRNVETLAITTTAKLRCSIWWGLTKLVQLQVDSATIELSSDCFQNLINLRSLIFNNNVFIQRIEPHAFRSLLSVEYVNMKSIFRNITDIKAYTFDGLCRLPQLNLTKVGAGGGIRQLQKNSFFGLKRLKTLSLNHNQIEQLAAGTFDGLPQLQTLQLSHNQIAFINRRAFTGIPNIKELDLNHNQISSLAVGALQYAIHLNFLNLSYNALHHFELGTFSNLKSLRALDLSHNVIVQLDPIAFFALQHLEYLNIEHNSLLDINHVMLITSLDQLMHIQMNHNKWRCEQLFATLAFFRRKSIDFVPRQPFYEAENIDGVKCVDICTYVHCDRKI